MTPEFAEWTSIGQLVRSRAKSHPDRENIVIDGRVLTYAQLDVLSDRTLAYLHGRGVRKGDRVCCLMQNCIEGLLVWIATVKLGALWVPLNVSLTGADLSYTIGNASPSVIFVDMENEHKLHDIAKETTMVLTDGPANANCAAFPDLSKEVEIPDTPDIEAADPATIIYTGGTTGMPKGVVLPHFAWIAAGLRYREALQTTEEDVHYSVLTMFHVGGLMAGIIGPIVANIPTRMDRWFSASAYWSRVVETQATIIDPIGTMLAVLAKASPHEGERNHKVRVCLGAFGQQGADTIISFSERFHLSFLNLYSLTEGGGLIIVNNPPDSPRPFSNGRANKWVDIMIADADGFAAPAGQDGQILLRPKVPNTFMLEYYNDPERTSAVMRNFWLNTGDIGHLDEQGYLYFTGRQVHFLRRRGENISAYEVENVLGEYPGISEVVIVGVPSEFGDDDVKAFVIPTEPGAVDPKELFLWGRERMSYFKLPRYIELIADFPRSAAKREVERHKLKAFTHEGAWDAEREIGRISSRNKESK